MSSSLSSNDSSLSSNDSSSSDDDHIMKDKASVVIWLKEIAGFSGDLALLVTHKKFSSTMSIPPLDLQIQQSPPFIERDIQTGFNSKSANLA
ncbi:hypothetical protein JHK87_034827 [Glycine soja]|nr:hypothetical protein JHK87_034827 [Glycine soja]